MVQTIPRTFQIWEFLFFRANSFQFNFDSISYSFGSRLALSYSFLNPSYYNLNVISSGDMRCEVSKRGQVTDLMSTALPPHKLPSSRNILNSNY